MKIKERISVFAKYRHLLEQLVITDIKLKYRRSFLGYLWSVLNPLLIMVVMSVVFTAMFKRTIPHFPVYLLVGNLLFSYMRESTSHSISAITSHSALLKMTYIPKYMFVLSKVISDFVNLLFSLVALIIVMFATGVNFTKFFPLIIIPLAELFIFCLGLSMFLSQAAVFFRDIQYIWGVVCTAWMYLTPIFYAVDTLPDNIRWFIMRFNPMFYYVTLFRDYTWQGHRAWEQNIIRGGICSVFTLIIGVILFMKNKDKLILYI